MERGGAKQVATVPEGLEIDDMLTLPVVVALLAVAFVLGLFVARSFRRTSSSSSTNPSNASTRASRQADTSEDDSEDDDSDEEDDDTDEDDEDDEDEEYKMVMCVRTDLKMQRGKVAAQCGHAVLGAYRAARRSRDASVRGAVQTWGRQGQAKIALAFPDGEAALLDLQRRARELGLPTYVVADAGRTQVAAGSLTVLAIGPGTKKYI